MEGLSLMDISLEDDVLFPPSDERLLDPPSPIIQPDETIHSRVDNGDLHSGEENQKEENQMKITDINNENPELSVSPDSKPSKQSCNLRKSLAWDSAFFTCEGVLNTEELSIINSTFSKTEKSVLAGIPEDMRRSAESSSTLDSDTWTLESLETELFDNVRASVQKSLGSCVSGKDPKVFKHKKEGLGASRLGPKDKVMRASQNKLKLPMATGMRRAGLPPKQPENTDKSAPIPSKLQIGATSLKPPRILAKPSSTPKTLIKGPSPPLNNTLKRTSTGSVLNGSSVNKVTKIPSNSTSRSLIGQPNPSIRRTQSVRTIPDPNLKSSIPVTKKKIPPSLSKGKMGTQKKSSLIKADILISPSSSIDSVDLGSCSASSLSPALLKRIGSPLTGLSLSRESVPVSGGLSRSSSNSSLCSEERGFSFKPSGLRLPTPKIGYFDKEKSLGRNTVSSMEKENVNVNTSGGSVVSHLEEKIANISLSHV